MGFEIVGVTQNRNHPIGWFLFCLFFPFCEDGTQHVTQTDTEGHVECEFDLVRQEIRLNTDVRFLQTVHMGDLPQEFHEILDSLVGHTVDHSRLHGVGTANAYVKHGHLDVELSEESGEEQPHHPADEGNEIGQRGLPGFLFLLERTALLRSQLSKLSLLLSLFLFLFGLLFLLVLRLLCRR